MRQVTLVPFLILQIIFASKAFAITEVGAFRRETNGITLTGENCDLLKRHLPALASWKTALNETPQKPSSACTCDSFRCYMDIEEIIPQIVEKYQDVDAGRWGPNCWNAVLVASKILPVLRYTPPEEMSFWMASPLCRPISETELLQPGDIAAIREGGQGEIHASIFITEELYFSKNALTTSSSYRLQSSLGIFNLFPVPFACRHSVGQPTNCPTYVNYFRCSSFSDYTRAHHISFTPRYQELEALILEQEQIISKITFEWKKNPPLQLESPQLLREAQLKMNRIRNEVVNRAGDISTSVDQRLLWNGLKFRIDGIFLSIAWI